MLVNTSDADRTLYLPLINEFGFGHHVVAIPV